ncbi:DMT family transporter [Eubacterium barkeri]|uniref:Threonine/homoserine efflux transporter RhtA n=1 Tax=Eubacterium barkeri TaxID=1528 RepID=A0A1H3CAT7_EUBBA|nr:DMT family transporter [Eubacterium barkeri]SDX50639.1 Threonine/homoserine efflux transporter RhtA [Eubacterium barkeri]
MKQKIAMMAVMALFGSMGILVRHIALPAPELAMWRALIAVVTVAVYKLVTRQKIPWGRIKGEMLLMVIGGVALAGDWIFFFKSFQYTTISIATLTYYFAPTLVMVGSCFLLKEHPTLQRVVCFVAATLGLVLIIRVSGNTGPSTNLGIACALIAAVFYAVIVLVNKFVTRTTGIDRTLIEFAIALAVLVTYVGITAGFQAGSLDLLGWVCLMILGVLYTGIAYCVYFICLDKMTGQEVAITSYFDPLVAVIVSVTLLGEPITGVQILGGAMILGFTLFNELRGT